MILYYINVPLNDVGVQEFETYDEDMENVKTFELSEEEYMLLRNPGGLFERFDKSFGILIDVCEEERINLSDIDKALEIVDSIPQKRTDVFKTAIGKVKESLSLAKESQTFWEIDIYVE